MDSTQQVDAREEEARPRATGTWSLVLGAIAVVSIVCPMLPEYVPNVVRYLPVYFILPLGLWAVGSGAIALRRMRDDEEASRARARAGVSLGAVAVVTVVGMVIWFCLSMAAVSK
ncbi:hypothetical protein RCO28_31025 [Streptomyces sp. LHD-70]|uniref:hypothetical protein n=1 Tax=Streptomyces sp. LHD-70 TaxID=3072140 RepID=UPI00280F5C46|nr:hypothetical protein [Streptomyces sp. LHD-70]MDQ8706871.1 hypothetical protein [Streptomyces sp. LHD-70]